MGLFVDSYHLCWCTACVQISVSTLSRFRTNSRGPISHSINWCTYFTIYERTINSITYSNFVLIFKRHLLYIRWCEPSMTVQDIHILIIYRIAQIQCQRKLLKYNPSCTPIFKATTYHCTWQRSSVEHWITWVKTTRFWAVGIADIT